MSDFVMPDAALEEFGTRHDARRIAMKRHKTAHRHRGRVDNALFGVRRALKTLHSLGGRWAVAADELRHLAAEALVNHERVVSVLLDKTNNLNHPAIREVLAAFARLYRAIRGAGRHARHAYA